MPLLKADNLKLGYGSVPVAENITFSVNKGDYLCVIGENGSGKTTLIKALTGLVKPLSGNMIMQAIHIASALHARLAKAEKKNESMQKRMDEIRLVNHAKWVLISKLGMDENNAHRFIEKQAMDLRQTKSEVSQFIIRTYENQ